MTIGIIGSLDHPRNVTDSEMLDHTLRAASYVTSDELAAGLDWYPRCSEVLHFLASELEYSPAGLAAAFSVLSVNTSFSGNVKLMVRLLDGETDIHLPWVVERATAALQQEHLAAALQCIDPSGTAPKLRSFALNLFDPTFPAVTLDRWMHRIYGEGFHRDTLQCRYGEDLTVYQRLARAIIEAARLHDIPPSGLQAALWTMARGRHD